MNKIKDKLSYQIWLLKKDQDKKIQEINRIINNNN